MMSESSDDHVSIWFGVMIFKHKELRFNTLNHQCVESSKCHKSFYHVQNSHEEKIKPCV